MGQKIDWQVEMKDLSPQECQIISTYGLYITLVPFWLGFELHKVNKNACPYTLACDVNAFKKGQEAAARVRWLRGRECPSCS